MPDKLEVWLDADFLTEPCRAGNLFHEKGQVWFNYEKSWLKNPACFSLDPDLTLDAAPFFPKPGAGIFGIFLDSSPDRWGQTLMKRRELLEAKDEKRPPKNLYAWDYLIGVQDETRQGGLRFRREAEENFITHSPYPVPPIASLRELQAVAHELTNKKTDDLSALRQWLSVLVSPGSSLGGARPKANFRDVDGSLWIAKFPARDDVLDVAAWESVAHSLSVAAGIEVPEARLLRYGNGHHTFCVKRFDRIGHRRVFYSSAMTLLRKEQSAGASYLEMAQFLHTHGVQGTIRQGLEQLFKRVVFNVAIGNRDDHLRNHGFLYSGEKGWRLSPVYDLQPNPQHGGMLHTNISENSNLADIELALSVADYFSLSLKKARVVHNEVKTAVSAWRQTAGQFGIKAAEIERMESVFLG